MNDATILVMTSRDDVHADAVVDELAGRGQNVIRFDTADFPMASVLSATLTPNGWAGRIATASGRALELETVRSVWWRRPGEFRTPDHWPDEAGAFAASEARAGLLGVLGSMPTRWINHPANDAAANYKPHQLAVAARCGLDTPATVITSDPRRARAFAEQLGPVIYKALGGGVVHANGEHHAVPTTVVTAEQIDDSVAATATLFQEYVDEKAFEVRITVIGRHIFAVAIHAHSDAARLDWRTDYAALTYEPVTLPTRVRNGVRRLMDTLGLFFGALDFAVTRDGGFRFLEINPNGQWHWLTHHTDLPIIETMADALQEGLQQP